MIKLTKNISIIIFIIFTLNGFSENNDFIDNAYILDKGIAETVNFNEHTTVYKSEVNYGFKELIAKIKSGDLQKSDNHASQGFTNDYYWVFFKFENITQKELDFIIKISTPNIDSVMLLSVNNNDADTIYVTGKHIKFNERTIKSLHPYFPIKLDANSESVIYILKISRIGDTLVYPVSLENTDEYFKSISNKRTFHFIYFSLLFLIIFISIVLGILIKQRILITYGIYAFVLAVYFISYKGYTVQYIFPFFPEVKEYTSIIKIFLLISFLQFFTSFLEIKKYNKWLSHIYNALTISGLILVIILFINFSATKLYVFIAFYYIAIATMFSFIITLILSYKKNKYAVVSFLLAIFPFFILTTTTTLVGLGHLPGWLLHYDLMMFGSLIEMVIFTIVIVKRINKLETNRRNLLLENAAVQKEMHEAYQTGSKNKNSKISNELDTKITEKLEDIQEMLKNETDKRIIKEHISAVYEDVRVISHKLSHQTLKIAGLKSSLKTLVNDVSENTKIKISINFLDFIDLFDKNGLYIYNVIQEAIDNAIIHSECKKIIIEIIGHDDETNFSIDDDGIGFDINKLETKTNILNMQTRIELIGGTFEINSYPEKGTNIFFSVPTQQNKNT